MAKLDAVFDKFRKALISQARYGTARFGKSAYAEGSRKIFEKYEADLDAGRHDLRKRNLALLKNAQGELLEWVRLDVAEIYAGVSAHELNRLASDPAGILASRGRKRSREVHVPHLIQIYPPEVESQ